MKKATVVLMLLVLCSGLNGIARATTTANLDFTGPTATGGAVGPYTFQVDGGLPVWLVCGSDDNSISYGQQWTADVLTIAQMNNVWGRTESAWLDASYYAFLLLANPGNSAYQFDVWNSLGLDGGGPPDPAPSTWTGEGFVFYIPHGTEAMWDSAFPQPFIGVREAASLSLVGVGLLGLVGTFRLKR